MCEAGKILNDTGNQGPVANEGLVEHVKAYYADSRIVRNYKKTDLFPAEERIITEFFSNGTNLLDIGCGAGRTSIPLAKRGYSVTAIDIVPEMIEAARAQAAGHNVDIKFMVMDAARLSFPDEQFQQVLFSFNGFDCIMGKANREVLLRNVWKIMKRGGCFVLTSRSGLAFPRRWVAWCVMLLMYVWRRLLLREDYELGDKRFGEMHLAYVSPFYLRSLLKRIGFEILYFNSEKNIESGKPPTFFTNFSKDRMLYYVLSKR